MQMESIMQTIDTRTTAHILTDLILKNEMILLCASKV